MDASSPDVTSPLSYQLYGNGKIGTALPSKESGNQLLEKQLEVWVKEREAAGLRASVSTLMSEVQRLNKLCAEREEAEDSLKKKWKTSRSLILEDLNLKLYALLFLMLVRQLQHFGVNRHLLPLHLHQVLSSLLLQF